MARSFVFMVNIMNVRRFVLRWLVMPIRFKSAIVYSFGRSAQATRWLLKSREHTNYTYNLTDLNIRYLAYFLGVVCNQSHTLMERYLREALDDERLRSHIIRCTRDSDRNYLADDEPRYARRIGGLR